MYAIRMIREFYGPRTEKSYVLDDNSFDRRAEFATRAEAQAKVDELDSAIYYTAHNECGRADYRIVRVK